MATMDERVFWVWFVLHQKKWHQERECFSTCSREFFRKQTQNNDCGIIKSLIVLFFSEYRKVNNQNIHIWRLKTVRS